VSDLRLLEIEYENPPIENSVPVFDGTNWRPAQLESLVNLIIPPGTTAYYAATGDVGGWLQTDGRALSRTLYSELFAAIGTTHGTGDGSTTFNIPNKTSTITGLTIFMWSGKIATGESGSLMGILGLTHP
jgi:hypothetical protein